MQNTHSGRVPDLRLVARLRGHHFEVLPASDRGGEAEGSGQSAGEAHGPFLPCVQRGRGHSHEQWQARPV